MYYIGEHTGMKTELYRTNTKSQGLVQAHFALIIINVVHVIIINKKKLSLSLSLSISNSAKLLLTRHVQSYVPGARPARIPSHIKGWNLA